jgi:hypothetical protein
MASRFKDNFDEDDTSHPPPLQMKGIGQVNGE